MALIHVTVEQKVTNTPQPNPSYAPGCCIIQMRSGNLKTRSYRRQNIALPRRSGWLYNTH